MAVSKSLGVYGINNEAREQLKAYLLMNFGSVRDQVESHGYEFREDIPAICDELGLSHSFETKSGTFTIEDTNTPDIAIWVACGAQTDGKESSEGLKAMLALDNPHRLQPREKLVITVTSMDSLAWQRQYFELILESYAILDYGSIPTFIIPVDSWKGTNMTDPVDPHGIHWIEKLSTEKYPGNVTVTNRTLFQLICGPGHYDKIHQPPNTESGTKKKEGGCCIIF